VQTATKKASGERITESVPEAIEETENPGLLPRNLCSACPKNAPVLPASGKTNVGQYKFCCKRRRTITRTFKTVVKTRTVVVNPVRLSR